VLKRYLFTLVISVAGALAASAQYDMSLSHYFAQEPVFNPAAVGKESKLNVTGSYALDFAGFEHNPRTMIVAADMPLFMLKHYHGVGVQMTSDKLGLFDHQRFAVQYALKTKLLGGMLGIGVQVGMLSEKFNGSQTDTEEGNDPAIPTTDVSGSGLDVGVGLYYVHGDWYAGASVAHATAPQVTLGDSYLLDIDRTYYLTGGYNIKLRNPFITIKPTVLLRSDGSAFRADITSRVVYTHDKRMLYGGVTYSPSNSVTVLIGGSFHGVVLGYSYELYTSASIPGNGSHGLFVGYQHDINLTKKGRNLHKSVRIL